MRPQFSATTQRSRRTAPVSASTSTMQRVRRVRIRGRRRIERAIDAVAARVSRGEVAETHRWLGDPLTPTLPERSSRSSIATSRRSEGPSHPRRDMASRRRRRPARRRSARCRTRAADAEVNRRAGSRSGCAAAAGPDPRLRRTPGDRRASPSSSPVISACPGGLRTNFACSVAGGSRSSTNVAAPVSSGRSCPRQGRARKIYCWT